MSQLTLATFNAHHGKEKSRPYSKLAFLESVQSLDADILCFQELDVYSLRTRFNHQPRMIAKVLGYHCVDHWIRFFGLGFQYNAILSRTPISNVRRLELPQRRGQQMRKALTVDIEHDVGPLSVTTTHLHAHGHHPEANRYAKKQLDSLLKDCSSNDVSIVAGDFNLTPEIVLPVADKHTYHAPHEFYTSPASIPKKQIDWILARNIYLNDVHASDFLTSDHRALVATVTDIPL